MRGRTMKLREGHRCSGSPSVCSILWDPNGELLITASAADSSILIHDAGQLAKPVKVLKHHRDGINAIALSPTADSLASGSIDHSVKLFTFPDGKFQSNVTRFTLPIRALAFNKSGSLLAAAGDDDGIKLIATVDSSISRVLKGHKGSISCLAFDPKNEFLASVDEFGNLIYWELSSGSQMHNLKGVAPNCDSDVSVLNCLSWSPDGETLAVPGLKNDVVMYDRDTAEKLFTIKGVHEKPVCFLSWSPNGKYIATSGLDNQVLIWDVDQRQDIERQKFDERISSLSWKPNANALAVIDIMGKFGTWDTPVPSCMRSPTDGSPNLQSRSVNGHRLFDTDDEKPSYSGSLDEINEESHGESIPHSRKRLRKQSLADKSDEESDGEDGLLRQIESRMRRNEKSKEPVGLGGGSEELDSSIRISTSKLQEAFQPGSTPVQAGKRRFLCYNLLGSITTMENEGYCHIEIDFHDTGRGPRVPSMTDYFGFTMAALNENGSVFANPCKGEKNMSTLMYRPFGSWANNSEWSMRFEAEEVKAVALGTGWVAAVTNLDFLRIFTEGGLQRDILCLDGPVVTAAGYREQLAVVSHASDCLPSGEQVLQVKVFNISNRTQPIGCRVPVSPGSYLTWFGFSEEGQLCTYDSKGVLRLLTSQYGGCWLPIFCSDKATKSGDENYWVVGLSGNKLFCVECKAPISYPLVMPKPVLIVLDLKFPLASSDLGAEDLENEFIMRNLHLTQIQEKIEKNAAVGMDTSALDDEAFDMEAAIDRCILRLIASCCNGDKLVRATEFVRLLSMEKSIKGAIKLVSTLKLPMLAERFNDILEERVLNEPKGRIPTPFTVPPSGLNLGGLLSSSVPVKETKKALANSAMSSSNQDTTEENVKNKQGTEACRNISKGTKLEIVAEVKSQLQARSSPKTSNSKQDVTEPKAKRPRVKEDNGNLLDGSPKEGEKQLLVPGGAISCNLSEEYKQKQSQRPSNPFAKSSNKVEKPCSILDSIKKMKSEK